MSQKQSNIDQRLHAFRKKYYQNKMLRGALLLTLIISSMLFVVLLSEGLFDFSASVRTGLVIGLGLLFIGVLGAMVIWPLSQLLNLSKTISDFQIADMVKNHFPEINDKLTNLLQLRKRTDEENTLAAAAIDKKAGEILPVSITSAINFQKNRKYAAWLLIPLGLYAFTYLADSSLLSSSTYRLVNFQEEFTPPPPFKINLKEVPASLVAGQDYTFEVEVDGDQLPAELFLFIKDEIEEDGQFIDFSLNTQNNLEFSYTLADIKDDFSFYVGNDEHRTDAHLVEVLKRPFIKNFQVVIDYPAYTGMGREILESNVGDFKAIKGSRISWELLPNADVASAWFVADDKVAFGERSEDGAYRLTQSLMQDMEYFISLESEDKIANIDTVKYRAKVLQDRYPSIYVFSPNSDFLVDLDPNMPLELEIADDFGFSQLQLFYRFVKSGGTSTVSQEYQKYELSFAKNVLLQPLAYQIDLTQLGISEGDELEYYIKVWDNDGVSGAKASTSGTFKVVYPTLDAKYDELNQEQDKVEEKFEQLKKSSEGLQEAYEKMQEKLLEQKKLSFDDKKEIQEMMDQHQEMLKQMEETQQQFEEMKQKLQENEMISEETLEKYDELNKFLEDQENPEIEKLIEEIESKLENLNPEDIRDKLQQLQVNDEDIKKSLERTLELLKQLEVQQKVDELRNKLDKLEAKQELLNEQLDNAEEPEDLENIADRQEGLEEQMDEIGEDLEDLKEMKDDTKSPDSEQMEDMQEKAEETQEEMQNASEQMKDAAEKMEQSGRKNKKEAGEMKQNASESQQKAKQKMQEMSEQLSSMQMNMQMQQDQENLESLRELLENLLKLSFDQEDLKEEVKELKYGDPSLKEKGQNQKKLQDDMGLVKDSLDALAQRAFMIQKFVLDESKKITENMQSSQTFFRNKQVPMITYHQQTAMTSVNNLANMLSDVMNQMQQNMMNAQQGQGMCTKPGMMPQDMQGLSKEQQKLNQQMQQMMNGEMPGDKLSEMAAQQEAIRKQLKEAHDRIRKEGGQSLGDMQKVMDDMQQTEIDLLNRKQLNAEIMKRQQEILSRMLQADKSVRERELDDKRESKTGRELDKKAPEDLSLEEYKNKIRQELLKSNKLEYSNDFIILIEQYYKKLERANE